MGSIRKLIEKAVEDIAWWAVGILLRSHCLLGLHTIKIDAPRAKLSL
jgi:hypothetical protein